MVMTSPGVHLCRDAVEKLELSAQELRQLAQRKTSPLEPEKAVCDSIDAALAVAAVIWFATRASGPVGSAVAFAVPAEQTVECAAVGKHTAVVLQKRSTVLATDGVGAVRLVLHVMYAGYWTAMVMGSAIENSALADS